MKLSHFLGREYRPLAPKTELPRILPNLIERQSQIVERVHHFSHNFILNGKFNRAIRAGRMGFAWQVYKSYWARGQFDFILPWHHSSLLQFSNYHINPRIAGIHY